MKRIWSTLYSTTWKSYFTILILSKILPDGRKRKDIRVGARVRVVEKGNQKNGRLTDGIVVEILTSSTEHPHGIKVRLKEGPVGRVKEILDTTNANSTTVIK